MSKATPSNRPPNLLERIFERLPRDRQELALALNTPLRISVFATVTALIIASTVFLLVEAFFNDSVAIIVTVILTAAPISYFISKIALDYQKTIINQGRMLIKQSEELMIAKDTAEAATKAKSEFLSTMSHEMRTPLNAVIGLTHYLMLEKPREDQLKNLKILDFSAQNLLALVNDILDFNKIEAGKISIEKVDFSLKEIIDGISHSLELKADEKNIDLFFLIDPEIPDLLVGDPIRLSQILNNLIGNAIKFTEKGSVTVEIKLEELATDACRIHFSIKDTGIGIPEEKIDYIFETFTQASSDTTRKFGGTGLGLAITKRLLEVHGSEIQVKSKEGEGSVFSFSLTYAKAAGQPPVKQKSNFEEKALQGIHILIVEDDSINVLLAESFLNKWGALTDTAENGRVAVERVREKYYDLVLMDLQMPEMDGYQASEAIRALEGDYFKTVPIIALTAGATTDIREEVLAKGMNGYMTKPFNPEELFSVICECVKRTAQRINK